MTTSRIFSSADFFQPTDGEPIRSLITQSKDAVVVAWYIKQGQEIPLHIHPQGQDTWTLLNRQGPLLSGQQWDHQTHYGR
jgi:quercetin dioxygenase-like cupin family protein